MLNVHTKLFTCFSGQLNSEWTEAHKDTDKHSQKSYQCLEDWNLLWCDTVTYDEWIPVLQRTEYLYLQVIMNMKAQHSSRTSESTTVKTTNLHDIWYPFDFVWMWLHFLFTLLFFVKRKMIKAFVWNKKIWTYKHYVFARTNEILVIKI